MKVRYTGRSQSDADAIFQYLYERNPRAAASVLRTIRARAAQLAEHPFMGAPSQIRDVRYLTVARLPYRIYYRVRGSTISIIHIRHTSRRPCRGGSD
jgi:addiction module RelE/StbE family toxin